MPGTLGSFWTRPAYCHCNFTALDTLDPGRADPGRADPAAPPPGRHICLPWTGTIPEHRRILELEGLKRWVRPELDGYADLFEAVEEQHIAPRW
ncbi:hypothetical protein [Streptomyces sp. NPDC001820]|uniref:hypothetical protein n=1 Tax=Streptomyces sp. NPDC001820 TaxID=3364613 RepID=UPI003688A27A